MRTQCAPSVYPVRTQCAPSVYPVCSGGFHILGPWAIFYMRGPACERREQLGGLGALSGAGGGALKIFRFWSNSGHFGAIWNNFGTYLTGCFWRYGWVVFGDTWDNFETSYRILLDILTNALGGGGKVRGPSWAWNARGAGPWPHDFLVESIKSSKSVESITKSNVEFVIMKQNITIKPCTVQFSSIK